MKKKAFIGDITNFFEKNTLKDNHLSTLTPVTQSTRDAGDIDTSQLLIYFMIL